LSNYDKNEICLASIKKETIRPHRSLFDLRLIELWNYRDLLFMFVKRDFLASYTQTILGPLWFFIQPIFTTLMFVFVFGNIAGISTDGQPKILFYLSGLVIWNYFSECFNKTANVFVANSGIFGKVYFPRLIMPLSIVASGLLRFFVHFLLFLSFFSYYIIKGEISFDFNMTLFLIPFLVILMAGFSLGLGLIITSLTTKYRDLSMFIGFGIGLLMYATPVIYPMNVVPEKYLFFVKFNPISPIIETFRYSFLGSGMFSVLSLLYSTSCMFIILFVGVITFSKVEQNFMDTV
jgi:lipopolysaccharide transport system permease protein